MNDTLILTRTYTHKHASTTTSGARKVARAALGGKEEALGSVASAFIHGE